MASSAKLRDPTMESKGNIVSSILSWPAPFHCVERPLSNFLHSLKHSSKIRPQVDEEENHDDDDDGDGDGVDSVQEFHLLPFHFYSLRLQKNNRNSFFGRAPRWSIQTLKGPKVRSEDDFNSNLSGEGDTEALKKGTISGDEGRGGVEDLQIGINSTYGRKWDMEYSQKLDVAGHHMDCVDIRDSETLSMISSNGGKGNLDAVPKLDIKENLMDIQASINQSMGLSSSGAVSKEQVGRATWTFLHTLASQFPDKPTRQQQRDAKELMAIISRLYPCKECADHFKEILKANPVQAGTGEELAQWMCKVHNIVNRSLQKPMFPCKRIDARWGALHCDNDACNLQGRVQQK